MKLTNILLVAIIGLMAVVFYQHNKISKLENIPVKIDTVVKNIEVHDTIPGKPRLIKVIDMDTVYFTKLEYLPHPDYEILLDQYEKLSKAHFSKNIYETKFPMKPNGVVTVYDTVSANKLVGNNVMLDYIIPERVIRIIEQAPPTRNLYAGTMVTGGKEQMVNSVNVGLLYKDKTDKIFGASIGYSGSRQLQFGVSTYIKIK